MIFKTKTYKNILTDKQTKKKIFLKHPLNGNNKKKIKKINKNRTVSFSFVKIIKFLSIK